MYGQKKKKKIPGVPNNWILNLYPFSKSNNSPTVDWGFKFLLLSKTKYAYAGT